MSTPIVQDLNGYGLIVPSVEEGEKFYDAFGLEKAAHGDLVGMGSPAQGISECLMKQGREKKLHHVSFRINPEDIERFADHLHGLGEKVLETAPEDWHRDGLWFQDPWGTWINLQPRNAPAMPEPKPFLTNTEFRRERVGEDLFMNLDKDPKPQGLGHMLIFTADYEKAEAYYERTLGLRTTDRAAGKVSFMGAGEGVINHHCFGLINSTHRGFQHASFSMESMDEIGARTMGMIDQGYRDGFGPGRHSVSSNLFQYFRDPWGSWAEYYSDMDLIDDSWVCRDMNEKPYVWGPEWSPEFWENEMNANLESK